MSPSAVLSPPAHEPSRSHIECEMRHLEMGERARRYSISAGHPAHPDTLSAARDAWFRHRELAHRRRPLAVTETAALLALREVITSGQAAAS